MVVPSPFWRTSGEVPVQTSTAVEILKEACYHLSRQAPGTDELAQLSSKM